jgi:hypothetical protein
VYVTLTCIDSGFPGLDEVPLEVTATSFSTPTVIPDGEVS